MDAEKKQPERNRIGRFRFYFYPVVIFFLDPHLPFDLLQDVSMRLGWLEVLARRCFNHPGVFPGNLLIAHQPEVIGVFTSRTNARPSSRSFRCFSARFCRSSSLSLRRLARNFSSFSSSFFCSFSLRGLSSCCTSRA